MTDLTESAPSTTQRGTPDTYQPTLPPEAHHDDNALWFGINALRGTDDDLTDLLDRFEDVFGIERAGQLVSLLCELGEDEMREGSR